MKRILFVDDEPNILDGLRRMLRAYRKNWSMEFHTTGQEALAAMALNPFDVVISDMKMPGMDGAQLLTRVKEISPRTLRIILSGHSDMEATMRSVSVSHQFLSKPCEAESLREVVERSTRLDALLHGSTLQSLVGSVTELPTLPHIYTSLTQALSEPEVDMQKVADVVEQDVGVASKILHLVNSSFFGVRRGISSLRQATVYLGATTIRDLVLSFEMFRELRNHPPPQGFSYEREHRHAILCARIARHLPGNKEVAEQAFLASMLHDIGKLVFATRMTDEFATILALQKERDVPLHVVEREVLGVSHAEVGAYLMGLWGIPHPVVEAVAFHHDPMGVPDQSTFDVLGATYVANYLSSRALEEPSLVELNMDYLASLGVADRLDEWHAIASTEAKAS